ncbi:MAG: response regulator transcription factor [Candidatus Nanopelagicales bacterium]
MARSRRDRSADEARLGDTVRPSDFAIDGTPLISYLWMLSDLPDGDAVGFAICRGLFAPFGTDMVMVYAARPDGRTLDLVAQYGTGPKDNAVYSMVTSDMHLPGAEAYRIGMEKWLTQDEVASDYPLAAPFFRSRPPKGEFAFFPLRHRGAPVGFIILGFPEPVERTWQLRATIDGLLSATVMWMLADTSLRGTTRTHLTESPPLTLTARQREILVLMREGHTNRDMADELGYSQATIKADITALGAMLGASGRAELLEKSKRAGL